MFFAFFLLLRSLKLRMINNKFMLLKWNSEDKKCKQSRKFF